MKKTIAFAAVILLSLSTALLEAETIKNWSAPSTWTPPSAQSSGGRNPLIVANPPLPFVPVTPCRVADTRGNGFTGQYGPPALAGGVPRNFTIAGQCGISATAAAVSFNFTVVNTLGPGFLKVFPQGGVAPTVSTLNYVAGQIIANAAIVPLGTGGLTAIAGVSGFDLLIDVNGYYSATTTTGTFTIINASGGGILGESTSGGIGVYGFSTGAGGWGVFGANDSATGYGVYGFNTGSGIGVFGSASTNVGTKGKSTSYNGVWAESTNQDGLFASGGRDGIYSQGVRNGIIAVSNATTGTTQGVLGFNANTTNGSSGVMGQDFSGYSPAVGSHAAGVLGNSQDGFGVLGNSRYISVYGQLRSSTDTQLAFGLLGTTFGTAFDATTGPWAVYGGGNLGISGSKHFVEPHPTDAKKVILYASLEGREVGTYFRGTASIVDHQAVIVVPEDFRMVTDEEGLTIQVTPIGAYSQIYVENQDLNQIVIRGSQDVQFHYMVNGVRRAFKNFEPVQIGYEFMPQSASDRIPAYLTEEAKARLISNGTYNSDGTVNMRTAERAGFTRIWADREAAVKAAAEKNVKADQRP